MTSTPLTALCDATILTGEATIEGHALLIQGKTIVDIVGNRHIPSEAKKIACQGQILAPGLIDAQVNGGGNLLLNNAPTVETCLAIAKAHRRHGTTGLLLTCISDTPEITGQAIAAVYEARKTDKGILGIHLEGPHLGLDRRGVHNSSAIRPFTDKDITLYQRKGDEVVLITLAPENVSAETIKLLSQQAIVSLGHTNALPEQIHVALESGAIGFTHLYNGMGGMSARAPGVAGVALDDPNSWCGLIADGHHVAPEMIRLAIHAKPQGKVFLVSDAMPPAATDNPQPFRLYGQLIQVEASSRRKSGSSGTLSKSQLEGSIGTAAWIPAFAGMTTMGSDALSYAKCVTEEGNLAGSAITLLDAVRYCVQTVGIDLDEALRMASTYPAAFLGVDKKLGKLLPGYRADVIALNENLELQNTDA